MADDTETLAELGAREELAGLIASAMSDPHLEPDQAIWPWGDHARRVADWLLDSSWLAARDAAVAERAWDEGYEAGHADDAFYPHPRNPYRERP